MYTIETGPHSVPTPVHLLAMRLHNWGFFCYFLFLIVFSNGLAFIPRYKTAVFCNHVPGLLPLRYFFRHIQTSSHSIYWSLHHNSSSLYSRTHASSDRVGSRYIFAYFKRYNNPCTGPEGLTSLRLSGFKTIGR